MRRFVLVLVLSLAAIAAGCSKKSGSSGEKGGESGLGAAKGGTPTSREGQMFLLGIKLTQAAMANGRAEQGVVDRTFGMANTIADITLDTKLDPLPSPSGDRAEDGAAGLGYMLDGPGKALGAKIDAEMGPTSVSSYELAVKLNMLPVLYIDDKADKMPDTIADVLERLQGDLKLPPAALGPMIAKLRARAPMDEVIDLVFELNDKLAVEIGKIYEKDEKKDDAKKPS
jgi:hypothetical protein